jgi:thioredoxin-like negative regulator of GroEL
VVGGGEARDQAREVMVRVFDLLGEEHPLVGEYRPRLAAALY